MLLLIPALFVREHVSVFNTCSWFGHHISHDISPLLIVHRFLVPGRVIRSAIDFHQYEACRIILLLDDVKSGNTWFFYAVASVFKCGGPEGLNLVGLNMDKNMDYKHNILL